MNIKNASTNRPLYKSGSSLKRKNMSAAFFFDTIGANENILRFAPQAKHTLCRYKKESAERGISRSAEREEGSVPPTAPPFEKGGRKLFIILIA